MLISVDDAVKRFQDNHPNGTPVPFVLELGSVHYIYDSAEDFLAHYKRIDVDFIYDKTSGLYLVGFTGEHVKLLSALYRYYGGREKDNYYATDKYVLDSLGMFKSRAGPRVYKSEAFVVPQELSPLKRDIQVLT